MWFWILWLGLLGLVAWQDFRSRAVYTILFPVLIGVIVAHSVLQGTFSITTVGINLLIIALQLLVLALVMRRRTGEWLMAGERWIGWGDLAFFAVLAFSFSTPNFVVFYVFSLLLTLFGSIALLAFGIRVRSIPLAGGQAVMLALMLLLDYAHAGRRLYDDTLFTSILQGA